MPEFMDFEHTEDEVLDGGNIDWSSSLCSVEEDGMDYDTCPTAGNGYLPIEELPLDTWNVLTTFLRLSDLVNLSVCSKRMYGAISGATHLFMDDPFELSNGAPSRSSQTDRQQSTVCFRITGSILTKMLTRYQNLTTLHLCGVGPIGDSLFPILNQSTAAVKIKHLTLSEVNLSYWCQNALRLENLKELRILSGTIRSSSLGLLVGIGENTCVGQSVARAVFTRPICKLESLTLSRCSSVRDDQIRALVTQVGESLTRLTLTQCLRLKTPVLSLQRLQHLSLMGSFALQGLPYFSCPTLRSLNLSFCFRLSNDSIHSVLNALPKLEELKLVKCGLLQDLQLESETLKSLNVGHCDSLHFLRLQCPRLETLDTDACVSLDTLILNQALALDCLSVSVLPVTRLEVVAPHLSELNLAQCKRLDQCSIHAPNLQRVNVRGSRTVALRFCKEVRSVQIQNWTRMPYQF